MPEIAQPDTTPAVQRRLEGQPQGSGREAAPRAQPSKKAVESYQEVAKTQPVDDRVTILGIPVEQITPQTKAALAGLVAEINHLRNVVKRHERASDKRTPSNAPMLEYDEFLRALGVALGKPAGEGMTWITILVHVSTYEDIRRSSGLLAANSALEDVAQRLREMRLETGPQSAVPTNAVAPFVVLGHAGGSNLAALAAMPSDELDADAIGRTVRDYLTSGGYVVGGIDMALAINTAATPVGIGESPLLALGRADHLLRSR